MEAEASDVKLAVPPAHIGLLTCGLSSGGMGRMITVVLAVVVPQAFVTAKEIGKVPAVGYVTDPGIRVVAFEGVPPVNDQAYESDGSRQSLTTAVGLTLNPAQTLGTVLIVT